MTELAEPVTYTFPTDDRFRRIAAKIADSVTEALHHGWRIVPCHVSEGWNDDECCPLGALRDCVSQWPAHNRAVKSLGLTGAEFTDFLRGFDRGKNETPEEKSSPMFELGLAYRRRFVS